MIEFSPQLTKEQLNIVDEIANCFGLSNSITKIMFLRGIDSVEKANKFLHAGKQNFNDPFLLSGMAECVERLNFAKENQERVVIFGDYDADGICATTVLYNALKRFGINEVFTVIPEREQGYGLTHNLVESMLEEYQPDLVITVDCGISCKEEVGYIEDLGIDVIVTDHHEIPDEIPDCTVINCKLKNQDYPFDCLCGAGVAYKVAYALIGEYANNYLDLVAVATIADSMSLLGENRDIVVEGLKILKTKPYPALQKLIELSGLKDINSTSVAFTIAPRINAAGRVGDARCALNLMLEKDGALMEKLCLKLNQYNIERQTQCDLLICDAKAKLIEKGVNKKVIVLSDKNWSGGLVGIVAAKLVEEYSRPVILFTYNNGFYHGSARSIENINIFQAVNSCKNLLEDFGGHAQAAGITIKGENLDLFEKGISQYIDDNYDISQFEQKIQAECLINQKMTVGFAKELNLLEPFGTGNKKPSFCIDVENVNANVIKPNSPHISFKTQYIDLLYFNGAKYLDIINSPTQKYIVFEPNVSVFNGYESLKGYVRGIEYTVCDNERLKLENYKNDLLTVFNEQTNYILKNQGQINAIVTDSIKQNFGCIFAISNLENLKYYPMLANYKLNLFEPMEKNLKNVLVISPKCNENLGYSKLIYLDKPFANAVGFNGDEIFVNEDINAHDFSLLKCDRDIFAQVFKLLKLNRFYGTSSVDVALNVACDFDYKKQIIFCLEVFIELGIFSFVQGTLQYNSNVKNQLINSNLYTYIQNKYCK